MKLFTINATPVRDDMGDEINAERLLNYRGEVSTVLARRGIDGFTIYPVTGYWQGVQEDSFKIEIATDVKNAHTVNSIAKELRDMYNQDSVMVTYPDGYVEFI